MRTPLFRAIDEAARSGRWQRRHPADGASVFLGLLGVAVLCPPWPVGILAGVTAAGISLFVVRTEPIVFLRVLSVPFAFILLSSIAVAFEPGVWVSPDSLSRAAWTAARALSACACLGGLILAVPVSRLLAGGRGVPGFRTFADLLFMQHRFIVRASDMGASLHAAALARGGAAGFTPRLRSSAGVARALMVRIFTGLVDVRRGLACRGYAGDRFRIASTHDAPSSILITGCLAACAFAVALCMVVMP